MIVGHVGYWCDGCKSTATIMRAGKNKVEGDKVRLERYAYGNDVLQFL